MRVVAPGGRVVFGSLHIPNAFVRNSWLFMYKVLPDLVGRWRPVDITPHVDAIGLRLVKDEEIQDAPGARLMTYVKVVS